MKTVLLLTALSISVLNATTVVAQEQSNKDATPQQSSSAPHQADNSAQDSKDANDSASESNKSATEKVSDSVKDAGNKAKDGAKWLINDPHVDGKGKTAQQ